MACSNVRACAADPIGYWFGNSASSKANKREYVPWTPKFPAEVEKTVDEWETYVEQRALDSMPQTMIRSLLEQIASKIDRGSPDPVLDDDCCIWHGAFHEGHPVIELRKPGQEEAQPTYVNRILAFFFATPAKFQALQALPRSAFPMTCRRTDCVCFQHIGGLEFKASAASLDDEGVEGNFN
ncbi:unnamed protein product [Amoebophrya sp. A120]|nr:unnamed protein product [Amoebophrya sp. A120]|eukprot:GSA120T00017610001.1